MAIEVMQRYENKYLIDSDTYLKLQTRISEQTELDAYNKKVDYYTISNLYYDTEDNSLIRTSLFKPKYKEKLRLRAYGVPTELDEVFLEIKKKYNGLVNKRRTRLRLPEAYEFLRTGEKPPLKEYMNGQVLSELEYFLKRYEVSPKLYLAYDRRAYFGENGLRITFDTNIRTRRNDIRLEKGDYGDQLIADDLWLMEVKAAGAIPVWLVKLLSEYKVYSTSFSKYGTEYQKMIEMRGGDAKCLNPSSMPRQAKPQQSHCKVFLPQWA